MPSVPYLDEHTSKIAIQALSAIKQRRPQGRLFNLDRMLIYSEPVARGWNTLIGALRQDLQLSGRIRELACLRVALVTNVKYEWEKHVTEAVHEGVTAEQLTDLSSWQTSNLFDDQEQAMLAYADAMTQTIHVPAVIQSAVADFFTAQQIVELTALIAGYNMVARFLAALEITTEGEL